MSRYWSQNVNQLSPYTPGEQPKIENLCKINTNENPYAPSPKVLDAIHAKVGDNLSRYPDPTSNELAQTIADYHGLDLDQIFVGNGSDEILAHAFYAFFQQDKPLLFPDISYSFYKTYCKLYEIDYETIPLKEDFTINISDYSIQNGGIIIPNPNAPTGILKPLSEIQKLLENNVSSVVVIDEAYIDFGGKSAVSLIQQYANLLVIQTASKSRSLAGMRIGFAMGHPHLIEGLTRVKDSFNSYPLDQLAQAALVASFKDEAYFQTTTQKIIESRNYATSALTELGFNVLPSHANFIFVSHKSESAENIYQALRKQGVLVRHFKNPERIANHLRITIGSDHDNQRLIAALQFLK